MMRRPNKRFVALAAGAAALLTTLQACGFGSRSSGLSPELKAMMERAAKQERQTQMAARILTNTLLKDVGFVLPTPVPVRGGYFLQADFDSKRSSAPLKIQRLANSMRVMASTPLDARLLGGFPFLSPLPDGQGAILLHREGDKAVLTRLDEKGQPRGEAKPASPVLDFGPYGVPTTDATTSTADRTVPPARLVFDPPAGVQVSHVLPLSDGRLLLGGRIKKGSKTFRPWAGLLTANGVLERNLGYLFTAEGRLLTLDQSPTGQLLIAVNDRSDDREAMEVLILDGQGIKLWEARLDDAVEEYRSNGARFLETGDVALAARVFNPESLMAKRVDLLLYSPDGKRRWQHAEKRPFGGIFAGPVLALGGHPALLVDPLREEPPMVLRFDRLTGKRLGQSDLPESLTLAQLRAFPMAGGGMIVVDVNFRGKDVSKEDKKSAEQKAAEAAPHQEPRAFVLNASGHLTQTMPHGAYRK